MAEIRTSSVHLGAVVTVCTIATSAAIAYGNPLGFSHCGSVAERHALRVYKF